MNKIAKMLTLAMIVCCGQSVSGLFITDLGVIDYNDYLQVDIEYPGEIELSYVYSSINSSAIVFDKLSYIPETNTTRYLFTSELYFPEYYERLDMEEFLFQDQNSLELYIVSIDMSNVTIPDDPYNVELIALTELYDNMSVEYNETLANLTTTWNELNVLIDLYNDTWSELNATITRNMFIEALLSNQTALLNKTMSELNISDEMLLNMTAKASNFKRFFDEMTSYKSGFNFVAAGESGYYNTIYSYEKDIEQKTNDLNGTPFIIVFFILFTAIITVMVCYWKFAKGGSSPEDMEIMDGVDRTTTKVNMFKSALKILPLSIKKKQDDPTPVFTEAKEDKVEPVKERIKVEEENIPGQKPQEKYLDLKKEVDSKIKVLESKIDLNHEDLVTKINMLLDGTPTTTKK